jgi:uncharacterized protein (DUF1800 family)
MIMHLDNKDNIGPKSKSGKEEWRKREKEPATLNENHARELMELHTISPRRRIHPRGCSRTCKNYDWMET